MSRTAGELVDLLIELSIGVHRFAMYPPGHPSLEAIVADLTRHLAEILSAGGTLAVGVAYQQLVVGGVATDPRHPVISDLARRLHDHQLGAISFEPGLTQEEVASLLSVLGREPGPDDPPLGVLPADRMPAWPSARLHPVGYDHLRIKEGGSGGDTMDRGDQLWLGLAQVSIASDQPLTELPDASIVAESIRGHEREPAYDQAVVGYLLQLTEELKARPTGEAGGVRGRVSKLIRELDEPTLSRLVDLGGDVERRRRFVMDANRTLAAESVLKVMRSAASTSQQTISHSMTRLLTKLAAHTRSGNGRVREEADSAFRGQIEELMANWSLDDPNPGAYTVSLDAMARAAPMFGTEDDSGGSLAGAERLVEMAIEIDAWGPIVRRAVEELAEGDTTVRLLQLLGEAPPGNGVAERAWAYVATLDELHRLLEDPGVDTEIVGALATRLGEPAVEALIGLMCEADERTHRRRAFDVLKGLPVPWVSDRAIRRLDDPRWFVQRNMLLLLLQVGAPVEGVQLTPYATHEDPRVRREALALMISRPDRRDAGILMALAEDDERVVRLAVNEIRGDVPEPVLRALIDDVLLDPTRSDELRTAAVKAMAESISFDAADALIRSATAGRTILGRVRLAAPTPPVLEALRVLATFWRDDGEAREVVDAALASRDPLVRGAVEGALSREAPDAGERAG